MREDECELTSYIAEQFRTSPEFARAYARAERRRDRIRAYYRATRPIRRWTFCRLGRHRNVHRWDGGNELVITCYDCGPDQSTSTAPTE